MNEPSFVQVVLGGGDRFTDDYRYLSSAARKGTKVFWGVGKKTARGDNILIYFQRPHSAILAAARAHEDARDAAFVSAVEMAEATAVNPICARPSSPRAAGPSECSTK